MREGPIPPEDHPLVPWPVRRKLKHAKHATFLRETYKRAVREEGLPWKRFLLLLGMVWLIVSYTCYK